jgi:hypothetical protein
MPHLDIYNDILMPWKNYLEGDNRIGGKEIKVIYTRFEPKDIDINLCPFVAFFLERGWDENAVGSGSYSPQSRRLTVRMGFLLCMLHQDAGKLDKDLFEIGGDLLDILRERRLFDVNKSIIVQDRIVWDFDVVGVENHGVVGSQKISFSMEQFVNFN